MVARSGADEAELRKLQDFRQRGADARPTGLGRARGSIATPPPSARKRPGKKSRPLVPPGEVEREAATLRRLRDRDERSTPSAGAARKTALG